MSERNWTKIEVAAADIIWVSDYFVDVDALLGLPLWAKSDAGREAIRRGLIQEITAERAQQLNQTFVESSWQGARAYLEEKLSDRWDRIAYQVKKAAA